MIAKKVNNVQKKKLFPSKKKYHTGNVKTFFS